MRHPFLWPVYAICASLAVIVAVGQSREGSRPPAPAVAQLAVAAATHPATVQPALANQPTATQASSPLTEPTIATTTPRPVQAAAPTPAPPTPTAAPPAYEWFNVTDVSAAGRGRLRVHIVVPKEYDDEQMTAVFRAAARRALREKPLTKAVVVFAFSSRAEVGKGADMGKAQMATDRLGWAGDGRFDTTPDEGKLYLDLGSFMASQRRVAVDR